MRQTTKPAPILRSSPQKVITFREQKEEEDRICKGSNCQSERKERFAQLYARGSWLVRAYCVWSVIIRTSMSDVTEDWTDSVFIKNWSILVKNTNRNRCVTLRTLSETTKNHLGKQITLKTWSKIDQKWCGRRTTTDDDGRTHIRFFRLPTQ